MIDQGHRRDLDLGIELPGSPLEAVMAHEVWAEYYDRLAALIREHRTTLVFVNTRKMAERLARHSRIGWAKTRSPRITAASRRNAASMRSSG